jgi:FtsH-binding integral membrane protein
MESSLAYAHDRVAIQNTFLIRVYNWMVLGLVITAIISLFVSSNQTLANAIYGNSAIFFGLIIIELVLVVAMSAAINRISASAATLLFFAYSALNGLTLSVIFLAYTQTSIASTFFITAASFGALSVYGYTTKSDLTSWGSFLFMGLIGVILASVANIFIHNQALYWIVTYGGIIVFVGLTAYDTQKLKQMALGDFGNEAMERKASVIGALRLYLDFINLFLFFLRLTGRRR